MKMKGTITIKATEVEVKTEKGGFKVGSELGIHTEMTDVGPFERYCILRGVMKVLDVCGMGELMAMEIVYGPDYDGSMHYYGINRKAADEARAAAVKAAEESLERSEAEEAKAKAEDDNAPADKTIIGHEDVPDHVSRLVS